MNYTPEQAAIRIGCAGSTLAKWRLNGSGPAYLKLGRSVRYAEETLNAWLAGRERRSTADAGIGQ